MSYQLIALDMDGTLLNSRKEITEETKDAVRRVCAAGKTVVLDTGRAVTELEEAFSPLPQVRYAVFSSGAGLYDNQSRQAFALHGIPREDTGRIMALARTLDAMPQIVLPGGDVIQASHMDNLDHYHMGIYRSLYEKAMTLVPDIFSFAETCREPFLKINLYHADPQERIRTRERLASLDLETAFSEVSSLECSAKGITKGSGLVRLCESLGIPMEQCIAVGDADNDIPMIREAGLGIAMGNAAAHVKAAADLVVRDLDHGGCAQAIMMLLSDKSVTGKDPD